MSDTKRKSGCIGNLIKLFLVILIIGGVASVLMPKDDSSVNRESPEEPVPAEPKTPEELAAEAEAQARQAEESQRLEAIKKASREAGFNDGFLVGKTDKHEGRKRDGQKAMRLAKIHSESHSGDKKEYYNGYHSGYNEGWHQAR